MTVLGRTSFSRDLFGLPPRNFLSSIVEILFPHIYWPMPGMPFCSWLSRAGVTSCISSEKKENKAYSRWIFFNLRPTEIARIIERLQKSMFVPTRGANVYKQHNLSNLLQKEVPMGSETCPKNCGEWCSLTFRAKKSYWRQNLRVLRASWRKREYFLDSRTRREQFEYLWVRHGLRMTKLWPF